LWCYGPGQSGGIALAIGLRVDSDRNDPKEFSKMGV